jgi:hypothetical protein
MFIVDKAIDWSTPSIGAIKPINCVIIDDHIKFAFEAKCFIKKKNKNKYSNNNLMLKEN